MATLSSAPVPISSIWSNGLFAWPAQSSNHRRALHIQHAYIGTLQTKNCLHWHHKWNVPPNPNRQKSNRLSTPFWLSFSFTQHTHTHSVNFSSLRCHVIGVAATCTWCRAFADPAWRLLPSVGEHTHKHVINWNTVLPTHLWLSRRASRSDDE